MSGFARQRAHVLHVSLCQQPLFPTMSWGFFAPRPIRLVLLHVREGCCAFMVAFFTLIFVVTNGEDAGNQVSFLCEWKIVQKWRLCDWLTTDSGSSKHTHTHTQMKYLFHFLIQFIIFSSCFPHFIADIFALLCSLVASCPSMFVHALFYCILPIKLVLALSLFIL